MNKIVDKNPGEKEFQIILNFLKLNEITNAENEISNQIITYPNSSLLYNILGSINISKKNYKLALTYLNKSIQINPNYAQALNNLGILNQKLNNFEIAIKFYKKAINLKGNFAEAYNNLGNLYLDLNNLDYSIENYNKAIEIKFNYFEAYNGLGAAYEKKNLYDKALSCFVKSCDINPKYAEAYYNSANLHFKINNFEDAKLNFEKAINLKPNFEKAYNNMGNLLNSLGEFEKATKAYENALQIKQDYSLAYSNLLLNLIFKQDFDINIYLAKAKNFRNNCFLTNIKKPIPYKFEKKPKKLKIGFVSSDFGNHPGGLFSLGLLRELKKRDYKLYAYIPKERNDNLSEHFKQLFEKWNCINNKKDEQVVKEIIDDGINILFDAQGHSSNNRLTIFAYKPAPVQVTWLGQGSTGIPEIDYFVGNQIINPESEDSHYVENVFKLNNISQTFLKPDSQIEINELPFLKNKFITFGSFNQIPKLNDKVIKVWSDILKNIPNSKLLLKNKYLGNTYISNKIIKQFQNNNISTERIILEGAVKERDELLSSYNKIDISLDPFPFQGNTTTIESIWMGVPVLTLKGDRYIFHFGENINSNMNMHEWIAKDEKEYIYKAKALSSDIETLTKLRRTLRDNIINSGIFDHKTLTDKFEVMFDKMWGKYLESKNA